MYLIRLITGLGVIFFAGKRYPVYAHECLRQSNIKSPWAKTLVWQLLNAFPEACIVFLSAILIGSGRFLVSLILGIVLTNFVILSLALLTSRSSSQNFWQESMRPGLFLLGFELILGLSLLHKLQAQFLHIGWPSIVLIVGYGIYLSKAEFNPETSEISRPQLPAMTLLLRFFLATFLIFAGAGQVVYGTYELFKQTANPTLLAAFMLAPIACLPKVAYLWQQDQELSFFTKRILEGNAFILGVFMMVADLLATKGNIYGQLSKNEGFLLIGTVLISFCQILSLKVDLKKRRFLSSISWLTYLILLGITL